MCFSQKVSDKEGFAEKNCQSTLSKYLSKKASDKEGFAETANQRRRHAFQKKPQIKRNFQKDSVI